MTTLRTFLLSLSVALAATVFAAPASAGDPQIDAAIEAGEVGERIDGYLGVIDPANADPGLVRKVQDINNRRRAVYEDIARETGTTVQVVGQLAGEKQIEEKIEDGEFFMIESGEWQRK
jgi:uncharacterized protein